MIGVLETVPLVSLMTEDYGLVGTKTLGAWDGERNYIKHMKELDSKSNRVPLPQSDLLVFCFLAGIIWVFCTVEKNNS